MKNLIINLQNLFSNKKIIAKDIDHLKLLIDKEIKLNGYNCDLNHIDVSRIKDMGYMFDTSKFNGDISEWDVSNVIDMSYMFAKSEFNGDISKWDVSKVKYMNSMFKHAKFNGDITNFNVINVENMSYAFFNSEFKHDLSLWKPVNLLGKESTFENCKSPIPYWIHLDIKYMKAGINNYHNKIVLNNSLHNILNDKSIIKSRVKI